jgi:uncharacterized protein with FMN-binding domain
MKNKMSVILAVVFGIAALGFAILYFTLIAPLNEMYREVRTMEINSVDLNSLEDGTYEGEYSYGSTRCKVEVEVKGHSITDIRVLENEETKYAKKAEEVLERVKEKQSPQVDIVTGATTTSKALLKAVENALSSSIK